MTAANGTQERKGGKAIDSAGGARSSSDNRECRMWSSEPGAIEGGRVEICEVGEFIREVRSQQ